MIVPLKPPFEGIAAERFRALARQLRRYQGRPDPREFQSICHAEVEWTQSDARLNGCRETYEAACRVLIDLVRMNWRIQENGFGIELISPGPRHPKGMTREAQALAKQTVRNELGPWREAQFAHPSVRDFIRRMEGPAPASGRKGVSLLIADSRDLHARLEPAAAVQGIERDRLLEQAVRPYLQRVDDGAKDGFTGIPLSDIWRYFRYSWATPLTAIPGRQMLYLVRDAAHPQHAVMAIAALNNTALQLKARDDAIGWTMTAYARHIRECRDGDDARRRLADEMDYLLSNLKSALEGIDPTGLAELDDLREPNEDIIARLRRRAEEFATQRGETLAELAQDPTAPPLTVAETEAGAYGAPPVADAMLALEDTGDGPAMREARRFLIAKKRAFELGRLLQAKFVLQRHASVFLDPSQVLGLFSREDYQTAVNTVFTAVKSARVGNNLLEITTCGAVPPYNGLLAGKLCALLMLSPEVAADYQARYAADPSIIRSQIKNSPVIRDLALVYLGTTSLYAVGSSQYQRLRLPAGIISPEQPELRYWRLGETSGYGSVQFSPETVRALEAVLLQQKGYRHINSIFGEGASPRLRKLNAGFRLLGFDPEHLLKHNQRRLIYGVDLFAGAARYLMNREDTLPDYLRAPEDYRHATARIAAFWRRRWLANRLDHAPALIDLHLRRGWRLSDHVPVSTGHQTLQAGSQGSAGGSEPPGTEGLRFWRELAHAGFKVTSDELTPEELERLHIARPLEDFIIERVRQGDSLVLIGNAGDGKTHLLRRLAPKLTQLGAVVEPDATAAMPGGDLTPILEAWRKAAAENRPYCLAANEYPLYRLRTEGKQVFTMLCEVDRQCRERLAYGPFADHETARAQVLVIDLSLRNPLVPDFAGAMLDRLLEAPDLTAFFSTQRDPVFSRNYECLRHPQIRARLLNLFKRLAERGERATVRELWIILARLLFGPALQENPDHSPQSWYSGRLFHEDPRFRLSGLLARHADPAQFSHPQWDTSLENPEGTGREDWVFGQPIISIHPELDPRRFDALKRAFYFEHRHGEDAFRLEPVWASEFQRLLAEAKDGDSLLKSRIVAAINACYCPVAFPRAQDALMLWIGHRFHEAPTRSYIACQSIPISELCIHTPRLPQRLLDGLDYLPDHADLCYEYHGKTARLEIDYALYSTLRRLQAGLPRKLLPEKEINRLDRFMEHLHWLDVPQTREFTCFDTERRVASRIRLAVDGRCYEEVERYGE